MAQAINNGQFGVAGFFHKMASEWRKAGTEWSEIVNGKPSSEAEKARQQSAKIRIRNSEEGLRRLYPSESSKPEKHAQFDVHDSVAFTPEALALMG